MELQHKLRADESDKNNLKHEVNENAKDKERYVKLNLELQQNLKVKEIVIETLKQEIQGVEQKANEKYAKINFELQKELRAEKRETKKLKQKNQELERRITMLLNADDVSEFAHDRNAPVKEEHIKSEIKSEIFD